MLWNTLKNVLRRPPMEPVSSVEERVRALIRENQYDAALSLLGEQSGDLPEEMRLALTGEVRYHANDKQAALQAFQAALRLRPSLAEGHYGLSLLYYDEGHMEEALAHAQYARNVRPSHPAILAQLGLCYIAVQDYSHARDVLRQVALLEPENAPVLNNLGIALHALGDKNDALYYFRRALALKPGYEPALTNLRRLYGIDAPSLAYDPATGALEQRAFPLTLKDTTPALADIQALERAFADNPSDVATVCELVEAHLAALRLEDARDVLHIGLAHHVDSVPLLVLAGRIAHQLGQLDRAKANYTLALQHDPNDIEAHLGLGGVLRDLGLVEEALPYYEKAAAHSDSINTLLQLAAAQVNACRYEACLATCDQIEARDPQLEPLLLTSRAVSHVYLGHFDTALSYMERILATNPTDFALRFFSGMLDLLHERYETGWAGYRYRFFIEEERQRLLPATRWQGEALASKKVLVLAEQGLGDQVMFASCLPDLLTRNPGKVILEAHTRVAKTLARSFPQVEVVPSGQDKRLEWYKDELSPDFYVPIADLPFFFRRSIQDFPRHHGYLVADAARVAYWRERLAADDRPKIGLSWRGGVQKTRQRLRSLQLAQLVPLLANPRFAFVSLQYGDVTDELTRFAATTGLRIVHYPEAIADLDEFAALMCALDLVITVCNTTVHYAGALGRPCWVLAPHIPEWRYGLTGSHMRWYPSVRIYRQPVHADWTSVLGQVGQDLASWPTPAR